jgi:hypothetical protein
MGYTGALGFAELVASGEASLEVSLEWHLAANHFPPLPRELIPLCKQAIELANDEEWEENLELPAGLRYGRDEKVNIKVWELVEACHLDALLSNTN